jgi:hypothetical protein
MQTPQPPSDPADLDPDDTRKVRGSRTPNIGPWLTLIVLFLFAAAAYAAFAV